MDAATLAGMGLSMQRMAQLYQSLKEQAAARRAQWTPSAQQPSLQPQASSASVSGSTISALRNQRSPSPGSGATAAAGARPALLEAMDDLNVPPASWAELQQGGRAGYHAGNRSSSYFGTPPPAAAAGSPTPSTGSYHPAAFLSASSSSTRPGALGLAGSLAGGSADGLSREELLRMLADYESAFESVKERLEVQYKHELMRAEHLTDKVAERDKQLVAAKEEQHLIKGWVAALAGAGFIGAVRSVHMVRAAEACTIEAGGGKPQAAAGGLRAGCLAYLCPCMPCWADATLPSVSPTLSPSGHQPAASCSISLSLAPAIHHPHLTASLWCTCLPQAAGQQPGAGQGERRAAGSGAATAGPAAGHGAGAAAQPGAHQEGGGSQADGDGGDSTQADPRAAAGGTACAAALLHCLPGTAAHTWLAAAAAAARPPCIGAAR